jgi:hypothetical protein
LGSVSDVFDEPAVTFAGMVRVQVYVADSVVENLMSAAFSPEHTVCVIGVTVTAETGNTVTVVAKTEPAHDCDPYIYIGVTFTVTALLVFVVLVSVPVLNDWALVVFAIAPEVVEIVTPFTSGRDHV